MWDEKIIAACISGGSAIAGGLIAFYTAKAKFAPEPGSIKFLGSRKAVYEKAAELIDSARSVVDTSWGSDVENMHASDKQARSRYIEAKKNAAVRANTDYKELWTLTDDPERKERFRNSVSTSQASNPYLARDLTGMENRIPLIDFMVVDDRYTILSLLAKGDVASSTQYLYIDSVDVAKLFKQYFSVCWDIAKVPDLASGDSR